MPNFCIPKDIADKVKAIAIKGLNTAEREVELAKVVGNKNLAKEINKLYEASTLLKNQELAERRFYENITGLSAEQRIKMLENAAAERARKRALIYNADGSVNDNFRALLKQTDDEIKERATQLYQRKYDIAVDDSTVSKLVQLQDEVDTLKKAMKDTPVDSPQRLEYGAKQGEIIDALAAIKNPADQSGIVGTSKASLKRTSQRFSRDTNIVDNATEGVKVVLEALTSPVYKSLQASVDASFALRQGFKQLVTDPKAWGRSMAEALKPFKTMNKAEQEAIAKAFRARVLSHPDYDLMRKSGLAVGDITEEFFPTSVAEKVPALGSVFKASNEAFTIFSQKTRMEMFERMMDVARKNGVEITEEMAKDMAKVANSLSGRGSLGKLEANSGLLNKMFFSARFIRSQVDTFLMPFDKNLSPIARKQAIQSSVRTFAGVAGLMSLASLFTDVEWDARSSKFGKAKIPGSKDTYIDLTAGLGSYIVFLNRLRTQESKSSLTGKVTSLTSGEFGSRNMFDLVVDFFTGKLAPAPSTIVQFAKGRDYSGEKPTLGSAAQNLATPISLQNLTGTISEEDLTTAIISTGFDVFGAGSTYYGKFR